LTPACNHHCPGCGNVFVHQPAPLSAEQWSDILDKIRPFARTLKITGGEPTLHPEFGKILSQVDAWQIPYTIFSNADWVHTEDVMSTLSGLHHVGGLLISLHGSKPEIHETFTGVPGSFERTVQNIRRIIAAGIKVHVSTVLNAYNLEDLPDIVKLAHSLGVERVVFNRFLGRSDSPFQPETSKLRRVMWVIADLQQQFPSHRPDAFGVRYGNCIPQCFEPSTSSGCWAGVAYCTVDPWGRLRPCNHSPTMVGSLLETNLLDLWESPVMQSWRNLVPDFCESCGALEKCHGGCRALTELDPSGHDWLVASPLPLYPKRSLSFHKDARPLFEGEWVPARPGWALVRGLTIFPVNDDALPLLKSLNGQRTLEQIQQEEGTDALDFIGLLIQKGLVRF